MCALFELPVQQKSAGLMVAKPTNRRFYFLYIFFLHLAAFRAEKGRRGGVTGILWSDPGFNVLLWLHKLENIFFSEHKFQGNKKATPSDTLSIPLKISRLVWLYGAGSGTRTHTMLPSTDFESVTSTNSIIPATGLQNIIHDIEAVGKSFRWRKIRK